MVYALCLDDGVVCGVWLGDCCLCGDWVGDCVCVVFVVVELVSMGVMWLSVGWWCV